MGTHKNTTQNRIFVVILLCCTKIPGVELFLWKHFVKNSCVHLYITRGNLMINLDQQRYLQRLKQNKQAVFVQP
jgi:hypothetical protein